MQDMIDARTDRLETQSRETQHEMAQRFATLQTQLARERTKSLYLSVAGLAVGLLTIGSLDVPAVSDRRTSSEAAVRRHTPSWQCTQHTP